MWNLTSLLVLYGSQARKYRPIKQASLKNSTRSLKERRMGPLGNLNKCYTVCTARGLKPFNASCVCREGRRAATIGFPNFNTTQSITTKLNQEVSSSWAYSPYSLRNM